MRILIDATGVTLTKAGVGVYAKNLIESLAVFPELDLFLVAQDDDPDFDYSRFANVTMIWMPAKLLRNVLLRLVFQQTILPLLSWRHRIEVIHSLHYSFPLMVSAKSIVTIHDMTSFSMPEVHLTSKRLYYKFFIRLAGKIADALIFVSFSAQNDFVARCGLPKGVFAVVHHGKSGAFAPCLEESSLAHVRAKYNLPSSFILYVGMIEPRKNLVRLLEAFSKIANRYPKTYLVLAGKKGWLSNHLFERVKQLDLDSRVLFPGFIAEEDKRFLLCAADVFAYVSLYEGFGLPVLEALACGVPTLSSNTSSLPEVAGPAAVMVNPTEVNQIALGLERLLSDLPLRQELQKASVLQAARFSWQEAAAATLRVYKQALGDSV